METRNRDLINEVAGFQTRKPWEEETVADGIERRARQCLEEELDQLDGTDDQIRGVISWRLKEIRDEAWERHRRAQ